jgi:uncharacterized protein
MNQYFHATVPVFDTALLSLRGILEKAEAFAHEKGIDEAELLASRLAPDMFDLTRQIQIACDNAKGATARLAGKEIPSHPDVEKTFKDLIARIDTVRSYLGTMTEADFVDAAERHITLPYFPGKYFIGREYVYSHAVPNFFFHMVTAYDILRMKGLNIGKADYIGILPLHDGE